MMRLRPYKQDDAKYLVSWIKDEATYESWGGHLIGTYPLSEKDIHDTFFKKNGLCEEADNFYPLVAVEEGKVVGHLIIRYIHKNPEILRFGWVIVDDTIRGKGYGKKMLSLALDLAFLIMGAKEVTIGVYDYNKLGLNCYRSVGFRIVPSTEDNIIELKMTKEKYLER